MAEWTGLEPATPGVTGRYSNQLNYHSARACCPTRRLWWVLRGSNSRPTPCKGAALPTELSTLRAPNLLTVRRVQGHRNESVYCILQGLASPELRNPRGLDLDRLIGARVAAKPRRALADHERAEADQRDGIALFQGRTNAADDRFQRATSRRFRDIGLTRDMLDQFGLVHCHPLPSRLVDFFVRIEHPPRAKPAIVSARPRDVEGDYSTAPLSQCQAVPSSGTTHAPWAGPSVSAQLPVQCLTNSPGAASGFTASAGAGWARAAVATSSSVSAIGWRVSATSSSWSIHLTGTISIRFFTLSGISARSFTFSSGIRTVLIPPRNAASSFSFKPPIARISPRSVISPVIATFGRTGMPLSVEMTEVVIATPALGPSLGVAPSG